MINNYEENMKINMEKIILLTALVLGVFSCGQVPVEEDHDPAEVAIGERLVLELRFSQSYFADKNKADPVLNKTMNLYDPMPGAFAGQHMSCRACHMVDEFAYNKSAGMRTYADFARLSPIPIREDKTIQTTRNSMSMVNISQGAYSDEPENALFHHDGQFNSMSDLVKATLTGRNFGWLPGEARKAIKHIASVIRNDDGNGELAKEFGGSYKRILSATDKTLPSEFKLSSEFAVNVDNATDEELVMAAAKLISAYVTDLAFSKNENGEYNGSAYDKFLKLNGLPQKPKKSETKKAYTERLLYLVESIEKPLFVSSDNNQLKTHNVSSGFGEKELQGMKLFFRQGNSKQNGGNCVSCHSVPDFSDFKFHNTGLTQVNYENIHGADAFIKLDIPSLNLRNKSYDKYLPATEQHPKAISRFRQAVNKNMPGVTDLGLWNVFANIDMPEPQKKITKILCEQAKLQQLNCSKEQLLKLSVASFKTPVLRDLGHSGPFFHTGQSSSLEEVVAQYVNIQQRIKTTEFVNIDTEILKIKINENDSDSIVSFLKSLNEDYE